MSLLSRYLPMQWMLCRTFNWFRKLKLTVQTESVWIFFLFLGFTVSAYLRCRSHVSLKHHYFRNLEHICNKLTCWNALHYLFWWIGAFVKTDWIQSRGWENIRYTVQKILSNCEQYSYNFNIVFKANWIAYKQLKSKCLARLEVNSTIYCKPKLFQNDGTSLKPFAIDGARLP